MKTLKLLVLLGAVLGCYGCGSLLSAMGSKPIEDNPGKRSYGARLEDSAIETKGKVNIKAAAELKHVHINVISYNGRALLVGQVPNAALKQQAGELLGKIRGVKQVHNELTIAGNSSTITRSGDAWLTAKIKSALLTNSAIRGRRIKVVTENGVVYLMGLLTHAESEPVIVIASSSRGVQKVVPLFEYID